uniref:Uncharacterized protein n=1 Tax=Candidatus Kentrum sp. TC TaxID=2126339 RepID=A0A450ZB30_9GAMM|nr:MAG: hypothetical protein BECKTC1821D_GA0114238_11275 [Candidatus Kentron sp. TC]
MPDGSEKSNAAKVSTPKFSGAILAAVLIIRTSTPDFANTVAMVNGPWGGAS